MKKICLMILILTSALWLFACVPADGNGTPEIPSEPAEERDDSFKRVSVKEAEELFSEGFEPVFPAKLGEHTYGELKKEGDYGIIIAPQSGENVPDHSNYVMYKAYPWHFLSPETYGLTESDFMGLDVSALCTPGTIPARIYPEVPIAVDNRSGLVPVCFYAYSGSFDDIIKADNVLMQFVCGFKLPSPAGDIDFGILAITEYSPVNGEITEEGRIFKEYRYYFAEASPDKFVSPECGLHRISFPLYSEVVLTKEADFIQEGDNTSRFDTALTERLENLAGKIGSKLIEDFCGRDVFAAEGGSE